MTVGICLVVAALTTFLAFVLMPLESAVRYVGYAAGVIAAFAIVLASQYALRPPVVLRLDDDGYRSRTRAAHGLFSGRWLDVEDVTVAEDVLVFRLVGGGEQQMPLGFFGREKTRLLREINERLNAAHGYRRLEG